MVTATSPLKLQGHVDVKTFFEPVTATCQYIVSDPATKKAVIIDSVLDYDPIKAQLSTASADQLLDYVKQQGLQVEMIMETHAHADHLTAAQYLKQKLGGVPVAIGEKITLVQETFAKALDLPDVKTDGSQFDRLLKEGEEFKLGSVSCKVLSTPGHTPACSTYVMGDAAFVGDTVFMPDVGSARCDFPHGSADVLFESLHRLFDLDPSTRLFVGHDYPPGGDSGRKDPQWETTVARQRETNKHINANTPKQEFVEWRKGRDATLGPPRLLFPSLQFNIRAGKMPPKNASGQMFVKLPLKTDLDF